MALAFAPERGAIIICDYTGFKPPEMVKRRPVVVISPKISVRSRLCTVVPLSGDAPNPEMPYHRRIILSPPLPYPWELREVWAKCDMVFASGFDRLDLIRLPRERGKKRQYRVNLLPKEDLDEIIKGVLCSFGLAHLTKHI
jgi:mRNA interferase MazF